MPDTTPSERRFEVAAKAVVFFGESALILRRSLEDSYKPGEYDLPGGRLESAENLLEGLVREVFEETGLVVSAGPPVTTWSLLRPDYQLIGVTFLGTAAGPEVVLSAEHGEFVWVDEMQEKRLELSEWMLEALSRARALRRAGF